MPNPALIHTQSAKLKHYLGLVDIYITLGKPEVYEIEPYFSPDYRPDARTALMGSSVLVEYQRSIISHKKMQEKVDAFVNTNKQGLHDAKSLLIVTDYGYEVTAPSGYEILQRDLKII